MTITIIMITTMKKNMIMNTNITTTMITMNTSMSTIMTTSMNMNMAKTAPAAAMTTITSTSITTIMRMMYSPAGAWNLRKPILRKRSQPHWKRSRMQAPMA